MIFIKTKRKGFTLVELIVAVALFTVIMTIIAGAFSSMMAAHSRSRGIRVALDNVTTSMEFMIRELRSGDRYHCDITVTTPPLSAPRDCVNGASSISFYDSDNNRIVYRYDATNKKVFRDYIGGPTIALTEPSEFLVSNFSVRVYGTGIFQPFATILIAGTSTDPRRPFDAVFQTSVTQRAR